MIRVPRAALIALLLLTALLTAAYREAWARWQAQLSTLHEVFLDGAPLDPPRLKGLLNREARAKDAYDAARLRLLGIPAPPPSN